MKQSAALQMGCFSKKPHVNAKHMLFEFKMENACMVIFPCVDVSEAAINIVFVCNKVLPNVFMLWKLFSLAVFDMDLILHGL